MHWSDAVHNFRRFTHDCFTFASKATENMLLSNHSQSDSLSRKLNIRLQRYATYILIGQYL
jgi:hypothetical protein